VVYPFSSIFSLPRTLLRPLPSRQLPRLLVPPLLEPRVTRLIPPLHVWFLARLLVFLVVIRRLKSLLLLLPLLWQRLRLALLLLLPLRAILRVLPLLIQVVLTTLWTPRLLRTLLSLRSFLILLCPSLPPDLLLPTQILLTRVIQPGLGTPRAQQRPLGLLRTRPQQSLLARKRIRNPGRCVYQSKSQLFLFALGR